MMTVLMSVLTLVGLGLLVWLIYGLVRSRNSSAASDTALVRIGLTAAAVFLCLIAQRLISLAIVFLVAAALILAFLVIYMRMSPKELRGVQPTRIAAAVTFRMVSLEQYERSIRDRHVLKRVVKLRELVDSIRSIAGYDSKTLIDQGASILRMENIYLPRIEGLLTQYIRISSHDAKYDARKLTENLDALTGGIRQIQDELLTQGKIAMDVDADALIAAMELDGLAEEDSGIGPPR